MKLALPALTLCTLLSFGAQAAGPADWIWRNPIQYPAQPTMSVDALAHHMGDWVYATDGSIIGSIESSRGGEAVVRISMFYMGDHKYVVIPRANLMTVDGKLYVSGTDFGHVSKAGSPG